MKGPVPNVIALILIYVAVVMNWTWFWGVLFLFWSLPAIFTGEVHLIGMVAKKKNPVLFWLIVITWLWLSAYVLLSPFFPQYLPM